MTQTLGGRYRLYRLLANGDTGEVWQATDVGTERAVAVKLLYPDLAADQRLADRFLRARAELTGLWHPSIANLLDVVVDDGVLALVAELVPGTDLGRLLADGPLDAATATAVARSMADALAAAHRRGVVHGDVKPSNVVVPRPGAGPARLTDFAVSLLVRAGRRHPEPFERLRYRAPEATDGAVPAPPSDVYALGVVLAEMLPPDAPMRLPALAAACRRDDPGARPTAAEVGAELTRLDQPGPRFVPIARPAGRQAGGWTPGRRRSRPRWDVRPARMAAVFAVALAVLLGGFAAARVLTGGDAPGTPAGVASGGASSAGATGPLLPAVGGTRTRDGGLAYVEYWFALLTYAQQTGDTDELTAAANGGCDDCVRVIALIRAAYDGGGSLRGGAYLVRRVATNSLFTVDRPIYEATLDRGPRTTLDRTGVERANLPALTVATCSLILEWAGDRWRVLDITTPDCVA
ncbi:DUF6318 family protein [Actinomycetes bacterium KLBMP 9797]